MPVTINGSNTPTAGGVVYGDGTNYASTAAGTSGQVLTSAGAGAPTWTTPSSGAWVLLSTATLSSSASAVFTGLTAYKTYAVVFDAVKPSQPYPAFVMDVSTDNGSSFLSTNYESTLINLVNNTYNNNRSFGDNYSFISLAFSNNYTGFCGVMFLYGCGTSGSNTFAMTHTSYSYDDLVNGLTSIVGSSVRQLSGTCNAVRFKASSGSLLSGTIKLYGIV